MGKVMNDHAANTDAAKARSLQKLASRLQRTPIHPCPGETLRFAEELAELTAQQPEIMSLALEHFLRVIRQSKIEGLRAVRVYTSACPEALRNRIYNHPHMLEITRIFLESLSDPGLLEALGIIDWSRSEEIPQPPAHPESDPESNF